MPPLITKDYRIQNKILHHKSSTFGASGYRYAERVRGLMEEFHTQDVLDYGCGKGTLKIALNLPIREYDPCIPSKSAQPDPADIVTATDVLEHIEPDCLDDVLNHLHSLAKKALFLTIACRPAHKKLPDGRNAHLLVRAKIWWELRLLEKWSISDSGPLEDENEYWFYCIPED